MNGSFRRKAGLIFCWVTFAFWGFPGISKAAGERAKPVITSITPSNYIAEEDTYYCPESETTISWDQKPMFIPPITAEKIAVGGTHCCVIKIGGTVWEWWPDQIHQVKGPEEKGYLQDIIQIAASSHVLALKKDGTVWAWGYNPYGELGDGTTFGWNSDTPVQVKGANGTGYLNEIVAIDCTYGRSIALKRDGTVWTWGDNLYGETGCDNNVVPVQVKGFNGVGYLDNIIAIACDQNRSFALKRDGTLWTWGETTLPDLRVVKTPVQVQGPDGVGYLTEVTDIACNDGLILALRRDGTLWTWGLTPINVLPITAFPKKVSCPGAMNLSKITDIQCNDDCYSVLQEDGTVWAWGGNKYGYFTRRGKHFGP